MTQEEYKQYTGDSQTFSASEWTAITAVASIRLASFLCLDALPEELPCGLAMLFANFICATIRYRGNQDAQVEEKRVRNFTIKFRDSSAANAFAQVAQNYSDLVEMYSECGSGIDVERTRRTCCGRF